MTIVGSFAATSSQPCLQTSSPDFPVENPEDLAPLRPFLSSRKILIIFDNVESILDPEGTDSKEILAAVDELRQFDQICICISPPYDFSNTITEKLLGLVIKTPGPS